MAGYLICIIIFKSTFSIFSLKMSVLKNIDPLILEEIIEEIQKHEEIYNNQHPGHLNFQRKGTIYKMIGQKLKERHVTDCQGKF
jgi:hypothetical protein